MKNRQWRVGTWSMGAALTGMGVLLLVTQLDGSAWLAQGLVWWPVLLVLLGLEILIYLWRSPNEHPLLRYDVFSIIFIGLLGAGCLVMTTVSASGLLDEVRGIVAAREVRVPAEPVAYAASTEVKQIVLSGENGFYGSVKVDPAQQPANDVQAMGACRYELGHDEQEPAQVSLLDTQQVGDTLYVNVLAPSHSELALSDTPPYCELTVVLPAAKQVEVTHQANASLLRTIEVPVTWKFPQS